jgi:hypothetical protein
VYEKIAQRAQTPGEKAQNPTEQPEKYENKLFGINALPDDRQLTANWRPVD